MFNDELILISSITENNEIGIPVKKEVRRTVLVDVESATRNEFYNYGDAERRPEYVVTMNSCEYNEEPEAIFRNKQYTITRTFQNGRDLIELTLSRKVQR